MTMSEPTLTVGRVETWRPIDGDAVLERAGLALLLSSKELRSSQVKAAVHAISAAINERMAELFPPAPQPEAKAEPDYTCPKCGSMDAGDCICSRRAAAAAANARIAELVRDVDGLAQQLAVALREHGESYAKGAAAAKEACAKRLAREAALESINFEHAIASHKIRCARVVRELDVDAPLTDADKRLQEYADKTWGPDA